MNTDYKKIANDFAEKYNIKMNCIYLGHYPRLNNYITANYRITLIRNGKEYSFDFSTSINDSFRYSEGFRNFKNGLPYGINLDSFFKEYLKKPIKNHKQYFIEQTNKQPSIYSVLACLTKYDVGTFNNFCDELGYSNDSIKATEIYKSVVEEYYNVLRLFGDILEELEEIQ